MEFLNKLFKRRRQPNPSDVLNISVKTIGDKKLPGGQYNALVTVKKKAPASGGKPCTVVFKFETTDEDTGQIRVSRLKGGEGVKVTL